VKVCWRGTLLLIVPWFLWPSAARGQIDPVKRELIEFGYNFALEGRPPLSGYAFYYRNQPNFLRTNLTLRLAVAPTYVDSELGIARALGENTDLGIGVAGGAFADSYTEIDQGAYLPSQSFNGYGGQTSVSLYHLFNPGAKIPLNGLVRGIAHYSAYGPQDGTASNFQLPANHGTFSVRTGLRWGGREPVLFPALAMELSVWYEGDFRTDAGVYGYGDRSLVPHTHLFWGEALLAYTLPKLKHCFYLSVTAGTSISPDRFSAYRLGSLLPLVSEFPLPLPGYYYQELSAQTFMVASGNYSIPLDKAGHWNLNGIVSSAVVDYLPGLSQPGNWNTGLGGGIIYKSASWRILVGYGYGVDAIRSHGRGAQSVGILIQLDLERARAALPESTQPGIWRGFQQLFNMIGK
jgi:hypothetical protein